MDTIDRETGLVALLQEAARAANESDDLAQAGRRVLAAVCAVTGWPVGHLCVADESGRRVFISTDVWHAEPGTKFFDALREESTQRTFRHGEGIIGRVAQMGQPLWVTTQNLSEVAVPVRALAGVGAVLAFPVVSGGMVAAVLEFFTDAPAEPDHRLLTVMADVGTQLGRVADRLAAQQALCRSSQRLERIMETSVEAFVAMDEFGLITVWNAAAERVFGLPRDRAIGQPVGDTIVPPAYRQAHHLGIGRFLTTGEKRMLDRRVEMTAWHADGYEFPVEVVVWAVRDDTGAWSFNAFVHDITDRRRGEQMLHAAYEQERAAIARLQELDGAKREFAATVSHELRTPLTSVIGNVELLSAGDAGPLNKIQARMVDVIGRNAGRLHALIDDLLTISRVESGSFELSLGPTDLDQLLRQAYLTTHELAERRSHRLAMVTPGPLGQADVDGEQLLRALRHILINAVNFTPGGGLITLSTRADEHSAWFSVTDTGTGIGQDELPRLFTRFFRGAYAIENAVQGAGLGLTIVKTVVDAHGGDVTIVSEPGIGTTVTIRIPRHPESARH